MRQGDGGRFVQRLGGREIRLDKLEALKVAVESHVQYLEQFTDFIGDAGALRVALDDAFPPPPKGENR
jgi:hypothetical protein